MNITLKICFFSLCLMMVTAKPTVNDVARNAGQRLMQFMIESQDLSRQNPQRSMECFNYYNPILKTIADNYEISYGLCLEEASSKRATVDESTREDRDLIEGSAESSCSALNLCSTEKDSIPYFECFEREGSENTKSMYAISTKATDILVGIREAYRLIDNEEDICTTAADRSYIEDTADTFDALQLCLEGKAPVPTTTEPTITAETTGADTRRN